MCQRTSRFICHKKREEPVVKLLMMAKIGWFGTDRCFWFDIGIEGFYKLALLDG